ncbi:hypothetical protein MHBO_000509 [Bonamia ostreae]|uniref:Uncharacterized protein n=1 Tax=Bonamia ostreae TaxID=126728 RepID=A0ABV2AFT8_9EUKA
MGKIIIVQIAILFLITKSKKVQYEFFGATKNFAQLFNAEKRVQIEKLTIFVHVPKFTIGCGQVSCLSTIRLYKVAAENKISSTLFEEDFNLNMTEIRPFLTIDFPEKIVLSKGIDYAWMISKEPKLPLFFGRKEGETENIKISANLVNNMNDENSWTALEGNFAFEMKTAYLDKMDFGDDALLSDEFWEKSAEYRWEENSFYGEKEIRIARKPRTVIPKYKNLYLGLAVGALGMFLLILLFVIYKVWKFWDLKKLDKLVEEEKKFFQMKRFILGETNEEKLRRRRMRSEKREKDRERWRKSGLKEHYLENDLLNKTFIRVINIEQSVESRRDAQKEQIEKGTQFEKNQK